MTQLDSVMSTMQRQMVRANEEGIEMLTWQHNEMTIHFVIFHTHMHAHRARERASHATEKMKHERQIHQMGKYFCIHSYVIYGCINNFKLHSHVAY